MTVSRWIVLRMRDIVEKTRTNVPCLIHFFPKIVLYMRCVEKYGRARPATDGSIVQHMWFACQVTKATKTHSEYVILFFHNEWLHKSTSLLHYMYPACLAVTHIFQTYKTFWLEYLFSSSGTVCNWTFPCKSPKKSTFTFYFDGQNW